MKCDVDKLDESKPRFFGPAGSQMELVVAHALCVWTVLLCMAVVCTICSKSHNRYIRRVVSASGRIIVWCRAWILGKVTQSAEDRKVQDLVDKRRLERSREMMFWILLLSCGTSLASVVHLWPKLLFGSVSDDIISLFLYRGDIVINIYLSMSFLVFIYRPNWVSFRTLDCSHIGMHAIFIFRAAFMPGAYSDGFAGVWGCFARVMASFTFGNASLSSLLLSVTCLTEVFFKVRLDAGQGGEDTPLYVRMQLMILLMTICLLWHNQAATRAEVAAGIQAKRSQGVEKLVLRLLWGMCDAVVNLGADHSIHEPGPEALSRLLLHSGPASRLAGRSFLDFFASTERKRVQACLKAEQEEAMQEHAAPSSRGSFSRKSGDASVLHTHMQDSSSSKVLVQLFFASIHDLDETMQIVGVKEVGDDNGPVQQRLPAHAVQLAPGYDNGVHTLSSEAASSATGSDGSDSETNDEDSTVAIWLDMLDSGYKVLAVSRGFEKCVCSTMRGESFLNWIRTQEREDFIYWIQEAQSRLSYPLDGEPAPETVAGPMPMLFVPPYLRRFHMKFNARLEVSKVDMPDMHQHQRPCDGPSYQPLVVCLRLVDIQWVHRSLTLSPASARRQSRGAPLAEALGRPMRL